MPWIFLGGAVVAVAGVGAVVFFMRRRSVDRRSMYASRRSQIEHKVRAARQRTLAPHGRGDKAAEPHPGPAAPATFGLKEAMPTIRYEPSAFEPPPAAPPPLPAVPGGMAQPPWEMSAAPPAAPPPPPPPPPPAPPATEFAPGAPAGEPLGTPFEAMPPDVPPPPPPEAPWTPPAAPPEPDIWVPAPPAPPEQPWTPRPPQFESAMAFEAVEPEPMTIPPPPSAPYESTPEPREIVVSAGWSVVAPDTKPDAIVPEAKPAKKSSKQDPHLTESWLLAAGGPERDESDEAAPKQEFSRALAQYAILVVGLVMVLIGVIVMVANSH